MRKYRQQGVAAVGAVALSVSIAGLTPAAGEPSADPRTRAAANQAAAPRALRAAVAAVGGAAALAGLRSFSYTSEGRRWIFDEGLRPGDRAAPSATFEEDVRYTFPTAGRGNRVRVDAVRTSLGVDRSVHEVIRGNRGFIRGVDANFSTAAVKPMTGDRAAAIREELALLNPHILLRAAQRNPGRVRDGGVSTVAGRSYRVVVLRHAVAPVRLFVNTRTGEIDRLRTVEHDYLRRDVAIEVRYRRWLPAGDGVLFPSVVTLRSDGERVHRGVRSGDVTVNPTIRGRVFRIPADVDAERFDPDLSAIGQKTAEWVMSFVNLGFIKDGGQTAINPQQVVPGVILLGGVANNSVVVRRSDGVVVLEGALHDMRAEAVIDFVRDRFPGARITHVVTTHHHSDHSGGQRPYVALGARAVLHEAAVPFFQQVFSERDSTILPDRLDRSDRRARILAVPANGSRLLADADQPIRVLPFPEHSVDMTVAFLERDGVLFVSDVYTPGTPPGEGGRALDDLIRANGLDVRWIVGGHGGFISYADFQAALAG